MKLLLSLLFALFFVYISCIDTTVISKLEQLCKEINNSSNSLNQEQKPLQNSKTIAEIIKERINGKKNLDLWKMYAKNIILDTMDIGGHTVDIGTSMITTEEKEIAKKWMDSEGLRYDCDRIHKDTVHYCLVSWSHLFPNTQLTSDKNQ